jgi:hypothetical protein
VFEPFRAVTNCAEPIDAALQLTTRGATAPLRGAGLGLDRVQGYPGDLVFAGSGTAGICLSNA